MRFPVVSDLARGVVFRWFAQPLLRRNRARVYAAVRDDLRYLDRNPDAPDRAERIQAMVASSEPLVRLIGQRIGRPVDHAPLLEVLTRRYYGNRRLSDVTARDVGGCRFVTAQERGPGRRDADRGHGRRRRGRCPTPSPRSVSSPHGAEPGLVADLYVTWEDQPDADAIAVRLGELSPRARCPRVSRGSPSPSPAPAAR